MSNESTDDLFAIDYTDPNLRVKLVRRQLGVEIEVTGQDVEQTAIAYHHIVDLLGTAPGYATKNKDAGGLTKEIRQAIAIQKAIKKKRQAK